MDWLVPAARRVRHRGRCASPRSRRLLARGAHRLRPLVSAPVEVETYLRARRPARARHSRLPAPRRSRSSSRARCSRRSRRAGVLIAEAGTGTGKTFAYLVPALLAGGRVIVSTGTKTLQDQLFHRDLPRVRDALGVSVDVALLKGRANYVCLHHLEVAAGEGHVRARARRRRTSRRSAASPRRTMTRRPRRLRRRARDLAARGRRRPRRARTASARRCKHYQDCFVMKARKRASEADVVVVNHHLFFADVVLRDEGAADLLPAANTVIFDEAHHLPDLARLFFGESLSTTQVDRARARRARGRGAARTRRNPRSCGDAATAVDRAARDVRLALGQRRGPHARSPRSRDAPGLRRARSTRWARSSPRSRQVLQAQEERAEEIRNAACAPTRSAARIAEWREADAPAGDAYGETRGRHRALDRGLRAVGGALRDAARRRRDLPQPDRGRRARVDLHLGHALGRAATSRTTRRRWASPRR